MTPSTVWREIASAEEGEDVLVCVTHNLPDGQWETVMWVDYLFDGDWVRWRDRIDIPFRPTHWMPLPPPPTQEQTDEPIP
jgi:hypothetical protein